MNLNIRGYKKLIFSVLILLSFVCGNSYASNNLIIKDTLNIGIGDNPPTLDPQRMEEQVSFRMSFDIYESLMTESEDGKIIPAIAERYSVSADGKIYTFYIRKNAKFSDGSSIKTSDIVFSFRRLVDPKIASPSAYMGRFIKNAQEIIDGKKPITALGIKEVDKTKIEVELIHPVPFLINIIATPNFAILKEENINKYKDSAFQPGNLVSSGPYQLTQAKLGDKFTAKKNPYYWDAEHVRIQTVNYFPVNDANAELRMFRSGQIDFTFAIPPNDINQIREIFPTETRINPHLGISYLTLNMRLEPFKSNFKLRKALSMAIDRSTLTNKILGRNEIPQYDLVPEGTFNYVQQKYDWQNLSEQKRIDEAKKLFEEAGYSSQNPFHVNIMYNTDTLHKKVILAITSMWQKAFGKKSIVVELENLEKKVFLDNVQNSKFFMARDSWFADYNDASVFTELLVSGNLQNFSGYHNAEYDKIHAKADFEQDVRTREALFEKAMKIAMSDYPVIPLFVYVSAHLVKPYVKGYTGKNMMNHIYTKHLYLEEK